MTNRKSRKVSAFAAGALAIAAASAMAADPTTEQLQQEIRDLKTKVANIEATRNASSADLAATIDSVLRDAESRSQMLAAGTDGAGYDAQRGFWIGNGNYQFRPGVGMQFVNVTNYGEDRKHGDQEDIQNGFEVTRLRLTAEGYAISPALQYYFQWDAGDLNGGMNLMDAYVLYWYSDQWALLAGQFKCPIHHEANVTWNNQLGAQRSLVNELIGTPDGTASRFQGVGVVFGGRDTDQGHFKLAWHDGAGAANSTFQDGGQDWGVTGRADWVFNGKRRDYNTLSAQGNKEGLFAMGGGFDWTQGNDIDGVAFSIDAQFETNNGWSVYGALLGQWLSPRTEDGNDDDDTTNWGALVQVGYAFNPQWEIFGRADATIFDNEQINDEDTFTEWTIGVNYYLGANGSAGNRAKITVDLNYLPDGTPNGGPNGLQYQHIIGGTDNDQFILTATFTLLL